MIEGIAVIVMATVEGCELKYDGENESSVCQPATRLCMLNW